MHVLRDNPAALIEKFTAKLIAIENAIKGAAEIIRKKKEAEEKIAAIEKAYEEELKAEFPGVYLSATSLER